MEDSKIYDRINEAATQFVGLQGVTPNKATDTYKNKDTNNRERNISGDSHQRNGAVDHNRQKDNTIPKLLSLAFGAAAAGDEKEAWRFLAAAKERGYKSNQHTNSRIRERLRKAQRESSGDSDDDR